MALPPETKTYDHTAGLLFQLAKQAAKRAHRASGTHGEELEVVSTIILCAVAAEAGINEVGQWLEFHHARPPLSLSEGLPDGFEEKEVRDKWLLMPTIIRQTTFDRSRDPWQSFEALVELRNFFVHLRRRPFTRRVDGLLRSKGLFDVHGLKAEAARWACDTLARMFEQLTELIQPPEVRLNLTWLWTPSHSFPYGLSTPEDPWPD